MAYFASGDLQWYDYIYSNCLIHNLIVIIFLKRHTHVEEGHFGIFVKEDYCCVAV